MSLATDISVESNSPVMSKISAATATDLAADRTLDITREVCPMTFVRTRLALDRLQSGQRLLVLLRGEEPRRNVPASAAAQGHAVLAEETGSDGITRVLLRRG